MTLLKVFWTTAVFNQFSVPRIEYPLGGSSITGSHVYFLLHSIVGFFSCHSVFLGTSSSGFI